MKQIDKLQAKARQRFGFYGSLIVHFLLFIVLAFSGVFSLQSPPDNSDTVVYFEAGGGGGGGGGDEAADMQTEDEGSEEVQEVVTEETITLPDGKTEVKKVVQQVKKKHTPAGAKKGSGSGTGGGHGTGTGSGTGPGSGSGSGGGHGSGHGTGVGDGSGGGIATSPKVPPRVTSTSAPYYPPALRDAGVTGRAVVRGVIGVDGRVESAQIVRSTGNSTLDNNALNAFYKWRFTPARNDANQKVRCYFTQGFPFVIQYK